MTTATARPVTEVRLTGGGPLNGQCLETRLVIPPRAEDPLEWWEFDAEDANSVHIYREESRGEGSVTFAYAGLVPVANASKAKIEATI